MQVFKHTKKLYKHTKNHTSIQQQKNKIYTILKIILKAKDP